MKTELNETIEWLSKRIFLSKQDKDYIMFAMKEYASKYHKTELKKLRLGDVMSQHEVMGCYAVFDTEDNIVQLYQTEQKANEGLLEFQNSHPHAEFYVDAMQIN